MTDFMELVKHRESCRSFADRPVEKHLLESCLEAARLAPSACNSQPWSFVVANGGEKAKKIAQFVQGAGLNKFAEGAPAFIVVVEEPAKLMARLGGAVKDQAYAHIDLGIAASHIVLEAADLGLSTCIMGWFQEDKIKSLLDIPKSKRLRLVIAVGYAKNTDIRKKIRKQFDEIVRFAD